MKGLRKMLPEEKAACDELKIECDEISHKLDLEKFLVNRIIALHQDHANEIVRMKKLIVLLKKRNSRRTLGKNGNQFCEKTEEKQ